MNRNQINSAINTNKKVMRMRELVEQIRGNFEGFEAEITIENPSRDLQDWFLLMNEAIRRATDDSTSLRSNAEMEVEVADLNEDNDMDDDSMSMEDAIAKIMMSQGNG